MPSDIEDPNQPLQRPTAALAPRTARQSDDKNRPTAEKSESEIREHDVDELRHTKATSETGQPVKEAPTRDDGTEYPEGAKLALISLALCLAVFLVALDNDIIATAIPKITDEFHSLKDVGWYGSAYLLTTAAPQLLFGKIYRFFSVKWVFLSAIVTFELGSLVCSVAPNSLALILGRAIAGIGAAALFSGALIIVAYSVPLAKRPLYTGILGSMYGISSVAGPLLGGVLTDLASWRWCFFINLPIGAISFAVIATFFPDPHREPTTLSWAERFKQFDPIGTAVFMPAIICLLLALQWGGTTYQWTDRRMAVLFYSFGVLIVIFLALQWRGQDDATIPPRIASQRTVWAGALYAFCIGSSLFGVIYFLPLWFQAVKGVSAVRSGMMSLPMLMAIVVLSLFSGGLVSTVGYYTPFMLCGSVLVAVGFGLLTTLQPDTGSPLWIGYQIIAGAGVGMGMQQPMIAVQVVLDIADVPQGTAFMIFMRTLGGALFVSIGQNIFNNRLVEKVAEYVPGIANPSSVLTLGATDIRSAYSGQHLVGVIQAYNDALTQVFAACTAAAALSIVGAGFTEWKSVKGNKMEMSGE